MNTPHTEIPQAAIDAAMRSQRDSLREYVRDSELYEQELAAFFQSLNAESPRAIAVVSFSYIDEKLALLMKRHLNQKVPGGIDSLFNGFGPLSTASARIKISAALFWLSPKTSHQLDILRKIRNEFAHRPFLNSFDESPICNLLSQIDPTEKILWDHHSEQLRPYQDVTRHQLFQMRAAMTCARMIEEVAVSPIAIRMGLYPTAFHEDGTAHIPKKFHDLIKSALSVILRVAPKVP